VICFEDVTLGYGERVLLQDINLEIKPAERVVILGGSGTGKSTLLRTVAGFMAPLQGELLIDDHCVSRSGEILIPPYERKLGMVFQDLALWPHLNVAENITFGLKMQRVPKAQRERRLKEYLEMIGLEGFAHKSIDTLSGGERQRVALARALITQPRILLMDEPLSSLDKSLNRQLRTEIVRLQEKLGFTLLYVTHDQEEAAQIATRTLYIKQQRLIEI
jgi:ABC-type sugar transport system ATPase subunit